MSESPYLTAHREGIAELDLYEQTPAPAPHYQINRLDKREGEGVVDLYDFGRVIVGRGNYILRRAQTLHSNLSLHYFGVNILLSGRHSIEVAGEPEPFKINPPQVVLRKGKFEAAALHLPARTQMRVLSLEFLPELCEQLSVESSSDAACFFRNPPSKNIHFWSQPNERLLHRARHLISLPPANDELDLIRLESAALALLADLLDPSSNQSASTRYEAQAINQAMQILRDNCHEKITIPRLARRVGLNECDLKRVFKAQSGMTIAAFAREQRMQLALSLLADGQLLSQVARDCGYDNVQYFVRIFTRHFGYHPKKHSNHNTS